MSKPDIQYFGEDGTWFRPARATAVDVLVQAGGAGASSTGEPGEDGGVAVKRFYAPHIPPTVDIEIGKGGRPGGRDGYVLVVTHLAGEEGGQWREATAYGRYGHPYDRGSVVSYVKDGEQRMIIPRIVADQITVPTLYPAGVCIHCGLPINETHLIEFAGDRTVTVLVHTGSGHERCEGRETFAERRRAMSAVTDVWIVMIEDRHSDVDALPFSTEEAAVAKARDSVPDDAGEEDLTSQMVKDGWVLFLPYGTEGDCVRVIKRTMDGARQ